MTHFNDYAGLAIAVLALLGLTQFSSPNQVEESQEVAAVSMQLSLPDIQAVPASTQVGERPEADKSKLLTYFSTTPTSCYDIWNDQTLHVPTNCSDGVHPTHCVSEPGGAIVAPTQCPLVTFKTATTCPGNVTTPTNCPNGVQVPTKCPPWGTTILPTNCGTDGNVPTTCPGGAVLPTNCQHDDKDAPTNCGSGPNPRTCVIQVGHVGGVSNHSTAVIPGN